MITLGNTYHTKIGKNIIQVRVNAPLEPPMQGWECTSCKSGKVMAVRTFCNADGTPLAHESPTAGNKPIDLEETPVPAPEPVQPDLRPADDADAQIATEPPAPELPTAAPPAPPAADPVPELVPSLPSENPPERVRVRDLSLGDVIETKDFDLPAEVLSCHREDGRYEVKIRLDDNSIETIRLSPDEEVLRMATKKPKRTGKATAAPARVTRAPKTAPKKDSGPNAGKLSAINAAYQVLKATRTPMNAQEMIKAMDDQGLWTSPGGKTPHATLYSAILREIQTKGNASRFRKAERGKFAAGDAS
jgi:HB1, ASXL, restriction endonuclease HTH domain